MGGPLAEAWADGTGKAGGADTSLAAMAAAAAAVDVVVDDVDHVVDCAVVVDVDHVDRAVGGVYRAVGGVDGAVPGGMKEMEKGHLGQMAAGVPDRVFAATAALKMAMPTTGDKRWWREIPGKPAARC